MNAFVDSAAASEVENGNGRLLIVDDEPFVAGVLAQILQQHGYKTRTVTSGEACLDVMEEFSPEVILLDIEMPEGIDGYETCKRIRNQFDYAKLTIIFVSGHDTLEERLRAYDVGGDDFVAKPFEAEEILRKIALAVAARIHRHKIIAEKVSLEESVDLAMQGYDEISAVVKFTRGALGCRSLASLAELMMNSMRSMQCEGHVQLRGSASAGTLTATPKGSATPLEESIIAHMRLHDRIFQFKSRMIVNYETVSVLVTNMPTDKEALAGCIRDFLAIIAETAEDAVKNISLRADALENATRLRDQAETGYAGIEELQASHRAQQAETRAELERMVEKVEAMYYTFGLTDRQESVVSDTVRSAKDQVLKLSERFGEDFNARLTIILDGLNQASSYQVDMEDCSGPSAEAW